MTTQSTGRPAALSRGRGTGGRAGRGGGRTSGRSGDQGNGRIDGEGGQVGGQGSEKDERYAYGLAPQIQGMVAATEPSTIQKAVQIAGTLTDEALRNVPIKKNPKKGENRGEPSKDKNRGEPSKHKNGRDDNKRTRTRNAFATTANPVRREYTGRTPNDVFPLPVIKFPLLVYFATDSAEYKGDDLNKTVMITSNVPTAELMSCPC
nr:hypothetical protein [Tanacetum cinerariifolium]